MLPSKQHTLQLLEMILHPLDQLPHVIHSVLCSLCGGPFTRHWCAQIETGASKIAGKLSRHDRKIGATAASASHNTVVRMTQATVQMLYYSSG